MALNYPSHRIDPPDKMPGKSMSNAAALRFLIPKTREDRKSFIIVIAYAAFALIFIVLAHRFIHLSPKPKQTSAAVTR